MNFIRVARPRISTFSLPASIIAPLRTFAAMAKYTLQDTVPLPQGNIKIPRLGLGVFMAKGDKCVKAVSSAIKAGYRHIDSAYYYGNEREVGEGVRQSGLPREQIFVTSKIVTYPGSLDSSYQAIKESVGAMGLGYVDCFLIHTPGVGAEGRRNIWAALEKLQKEGHVKAIGVSNYGVHHLKEMKDYAKVYPPCLNQIEVCAFPRLPGFCTLHVNDISSSIPGFSSAILYLTVRMKRYLWRHIALLSGRKRPMTPTLTALPRNWESRQTKSSSDTRCRRAGSLCPRARTLAASSRMPISTTSRSRKLRWRSSTVSIRGRMVSLLILLGYHMLIGIVQVPSRGHRNSAVSSNWTLL